MTKEKTSKKAQNPILRCSSCKHWNNKQAELEYSQHYGICTCFRWKFTTTNDKDCLLLDRGNRTEKFMGVSRFETQNNQVPIGAVDKSRYCFVTEEGHRMITYSGWQYGKWLITGYKLVELHYCLSEVECLNNHRTSHLLYCVLWAAVLFKI